MYKYDPEAVRTLATHPGWQSLRLLFDALREDLVRQLQEVSDINSLLRIQGALQACNWLRAEFNHRVETPRPATPAADDVPEFLKAFRATVTRVGIPQGANE